MLGRLHERVDATLKRLLITMARFSSAQTAQQTRQIVDQIFQQEERLCKVLTHNGSKPEMMIAIPTKS
jgi:hypothetical protein